MVPSSSVKVDDPAQAKGLLGLLDALEDHDDSQHVYANFDIPEAILAEHTGASA
jgi:transcriptional/translational regulatory protein YebC/TACO1